MGDKAKMSAHLVRPSLALLLLASTAGSIACADEQLPVIATYEMQHRRDVLHEIGRDPKGFWTHAILSRIEAQRANPPGKLDRVATVRVSFAVGRDGYLLRNAVADSSGLPEVDRTAVQMVERAQPFPPMPPNLTDTEIAFVLPVRFR